MAQSRGLYVRVGALILVGLALLMAFLLFLASGRFGVRSEVFETYVEESVQGLDVGTPVRFRGVAIGRITQIGLVAAEYERPRGTPFAQAFQLVMIRFSVDLDRVGEVPALDDAIRLGLRARIASQGITGVNYLELDFLPPDRYPPRLSTLSAEQEDVVRTFLEVVALGGGHQDVSEDAQQALDEWWLPGARDRPTAEDLETLRAAPAMYQEVERPLFRLMMPMSLGSSAVPSISSVYSPAADSVSSRWPAKKLNTIPLGPVSFHGREVLTGCLKKSFCPAAAVNVNWSISPGLEIESE